MHLMHSSPVSCVCVCVCVCVCDWVDILGFCKWYLILAAPK